MNRKIWRGFNMGNALEAPEEGEWGIVVEDEYLETIADAGFTSLRLPVTWPAHCETEPPYTIDKEFFARVDHIVQEALKNNLVVLLNNHHFDQLNDDPVTNGIWLEKLWEQISEHYKDYPDELYFEILNEPHGKFTALIWNELLAKVLTMIRKTNPYRMVVIGPVSWNSPDYLPTLELPENDRGIIATFHFYNPFQFTHQGASWAGDDANDWLGTQWIGSIAEREDITRVMDKAVEWSKLTNRPLYLGEFGAYSTADDNSRYRWTDFVARSAEKRDISWTYWEFGAGFGAYDREKGEWRDYLLFALMPK
ncbi:glycoside hydrolase family 5 protein [candidate division KSB1 bacterium]|nr:glycoside hydrolase family 5 protein [candidate division KSB1 bacterium]